MEAVDASRLQLLGQVEGEHHLGELALAVGADAVVTALEHYIIEFDRALACGNDIDDGRCELWDQQMGQKERCQIVDREMQLESVSAQLPWTADFGDAGVVDQQV